jgi:hypothetical protein
MNHWTHSAKNRLEEYFSKVRPGLEASGADAEEVTQDLRRHVEHEAAAMNLAVVTEEDVKTILGRIGPAVMEPEVPGPAHPPNGKSAAEAKPVVPGASWPLLIFGILLPAGTIIFEFLTGACAGVLFDPHPTFLHLLLTSLVPASSLWLWLALRGKARFRPKAMAWANGMAIGIAAVYGLMLLPFTPFAAIGVMFYGLGLVPLSPYFALASAVILRDRLGSQFRQPLTPHFWVGSLVSIAVFGLISAPLILTEVGLHWAASQEPDVSARGVGVLRVFGLEEQMLRACYGRAGRPSEIYTFGQPPAPADARRIYYQVRGHPFNSVPPPRLYMGRARWDYLEQEFTWDNDQGSDQVAGRVKGLALANSRQDVVIEPDAAMAYCEWTLEFRNNSQMQREARAQLLLPPGAVVSRLTLWIDGEEREAAFGGRGQVKTAYKSVVTARRDPVLVTTYGPDRVLVQCFPVPPRGGVMKARLGITVPLPLAQPGEALLRLPCFVERNFSIHESVRHSVWIDSSQPLQVAGGGLISEMGRSGRFALRGELTEQGMAQAPGVVKVRRNAAVSRVWSRDSRSESEGIVVQRIVSKPAEPPGTVILVLDGAARMEEHFGGTAAAIGALPVGLKFGALVAQDGVCELVQPQVITDQNLKTISRVIAKTSGTGGQDNAPALARAWDLASSGEGGTIIWIHGAQPEAFNGLEGLRQRFERLGGKVRLICFQADSGPNRIIEKLDGVTGVVSALRAGGLEQDLRAVFAALAPDSSTLQVVREKVASQPGVVPEGQEVSGHLVRLWASDECARLEAKRKNVEAMNLACRHQLVTPVSGAVVLETKQQYAQAGLEPVPSSTVPIIPEPSSVTLVGLGVGLLLFRRVLRSRSVGIHSN